jgi:uncharacterized protein YecE (DUF72 family)
MTTIKLGTCSWKYDSWRGIVYSEKKAINFLEEYSQKYDTVEIDQWFWSLFGVNKIALPNRSAVAQYLNSIPPDFKFTIKIPNSITLTHFYKKNKKDPLIVNPHFLSEEIFNEFLLSIEPLQNNIGMLMFQFEYLNRQKMDSQISFLEKLESFFKKINQTFPYAIESRNPNYLNDNYFEFLNKNNLAHVFLQGYYMPRIVDVYQEFKKHITDTTIIRLHGPDRSNIEKKSGGSWDKILDAKDDELFEISEMIKELKKKKVIVYVNVNNHYEGSAPLTIKRLEKIIDTD